MRQSSSSGCPWLQLLMSQEEIAGKIVIYYDHKYSLNNLIAKWGMEQNCLFIIYSFLCNKMVTFQLPAFESPSLLLTSFLCYQKYGRATTPPPEMLYQPPVFTNTWPHQYSMLTMKVLFSDFHGHSSKNGPFSLHFSVVIQLLASGEHKLKWTQVTVLIPLISCKEDM